MTFRQQVFTGPGTWTRPPTITQVSVFLVGGGGSAGQDIPGQLQGGGGGGIREEVVPVSNPVPITVGAGGAGVPNFPGAGNPGGDSAFGPLSPPIPPTTIYVGGGGGGLNQAPAQGGGGSGVASYGAGGAYGSPATPIGGGAGGKIQYSAASPAFPTPPVSNPYSLPRLSFNGYGFYGIGGMTGGPSSQFYGNIGSIPVAPIPGGFQAVANTGHGGNTNNGTSGTSGVVIVRWFE